jgi:protein phosphatase 1 regulatory subunit 37
LDTVEGAREVQYHLERILKDRTSEHPTLSLDDAVILNRAKATLPALGAAIEASDDPTKLEEMLILNDNITDLLKKIEEIKPIRPSLALNGLGNGSFRFSESPTPGTPSYTPDILSPGLLHSFSNSSLSSLTSPSTPSNAEGVDDDDIPITPRRDKGKGRAVLVEEPNPLDLQEDPDAKIIPEPGSLVEESSGSPTDTRYVTFTKAWYT